MTVRHSLRPPLVAFHFQMKAHLQLIGSNLAAWRLARWTTRTGRVIFIPRCSLWCREASVTPDRRAFQISGRMERALPFQHSGLSTCRRTRLKLTRLPERQLGGSAQPECIANVNSSNVNSNNVNSNNVNSMVGNHCLGGTIRDFRVLSSVNSHLGRPLNDQSNQLMTR